ncbi:hypothetical protein BDP81DRAFT_502976 [Colletotrichum phormii]|uniref:Uncharacterized protein n=1 Tax=Colletotrichum phormii TaxID=359342 RepID=A0AAI9ZG74_9PEZI|nr:uncharacterized protein BDP81DRAFT_502976 [Colletotrichum phormii]KAK1623861.1 hypothetical protein BDP81DRAFT_502976 [Colletotrichum phormii]
MPSLPASVPVPACLRRSVPASSTRHGLGRLAWAEPTGAGESDVGPCQAYSAEDKRQPGREKARRPHRETRGATISVPGSMTMETETLLPAALPTVCLDLSVRDERLDHGWSGTVEEKANRPSRRQIWGSAGPTLETMSGWSRKHSDRQLPQSSNHKLEPTGCVAMLCGGMPSLDSLFVPTPFTFVGRCWNRTRTDLILPTPAHGAKMYTLDKLSVSTAKTSGHSAAMVLYRKAPTPSLRSTSNHYRGYRVLSLINRTLSLLLPPSLSFAFDPAVTPARCFLYAVLCVVAGESLRDCLAWLWLNFSAAICFPSTSLDREDVYHHHHHHHKPRNQGGSKIRPDCLLLPSRPCYESLPGRNLGFLTFPHLSLLSSSDFMFQPSSALGISHCASSRHGLAQHICPGAGGGVPGMEIMDMTGRVGGVGGWPGPVIADLF